MESTNIPHADEAEREAERVTRVTGRPLQEVQAFLHDLDAELKRFREENPIRRPTFFA